MKTLKHLQGYIAPLLIAGFLMAGCATIFKGSHAEVRVNSSPSNAEIYINGIDKGSTPKTLSLKRDRNYVLEFRKEGYESVKLEVTKDFDLATTVVGNIFSWGILGVVVDLATGAAYSLEPADVQANLGRLAEAGFLPEEKEMAKSDIHVIMLTKEQWAEIAAK